MNKIKLITKVLMLAFVGTMALASCSSDENVLEEKQQQEQLNGVPMKISIGASDVTSRLALTDLADKDTNFKFEEGDKVYVFKTDGTYLGCLEMEDTRNDNTEAQFVGSDSDGKGIDVVDGQEVIIWYFGTEGIDESTLKVGQKMSTLDYDLSLQTNGTSSKNAANAKMKVKFVTEKNPDGTDHLWATNAETVTLSHIFAVGTFQLLVKGEGQENSYFSELGVKRVLVTGSYNQVTLDLTKVASASVSPIVAGSEKYGNIIVHNLSDKRGPQDRERNELHFFVAPGLFSPTFTYMDRNDAIYFGKYSSTTLKAGEIIRSDAETTSGHGKNIEMEKMVIGGDGNYSVAGYRAVSFFGQLAKFEVEGKTLLMAAYNLGAGSNNHTGDLLAFGEIYSKPEYTANNYLYKTTAKSTSSQKDIEYVKTDSEEYPYVLAPAYDAAQVRMKGGWRMPTYNEMVAITKQNLLDESSLSFNKDFVSARYGGSIYYIWFALENENATIANYWTSTFNESTSSISFNGRSDHGRVFTFRKEPSQIAHRTLPRYEGLQIRPVFDLSILKE